LKPPQGFQCRPLERLASSRQRGKTFQRKRGRTYEVPGIKVREDGILDLWYMKCFVHCPKVAEGGEGLKEPVQRLSFLLAVV
jgi:hypothetical protein